MRVVRVPTTVLAQADSGVGVKNGVNAFGKKNLLGTFACTHAALPAMQAAGHGRIVNMTSNSVGLVIPGFTHYIASKMAVIGLTRGLATELAEHGVTVNAIGPSLTRTATTEGASSAARSLPLYRNRTGMKAST